MPLCSFQTVIKDPKAIKEFAYKRRELSKEVVRPVLPRREIRDSEETS